MAALAVAVPDVPGCGGRLSAEETAGVAVVVSDGTDVVVEVRWRWRRSFFYCSYLDDKIYLLQSRDNRDSIS